jgi:hypothetical protein
LINRKISEYETLTPWHVKVKGALICLIRDSILFQAIKLVVLIVVFSVHLAPEKEKFIFLDALGAHVFLFDALVLQTFIQLFELVLPREIKKAKVRSSLDEIATLLNLIIRILSAALFTFTAIFAFAGIRGQFSIETFDTVILILCVRQII